ncbi:MAG: hypothetical protein J2P45_15260 [Candidatus Dormibacteraeota bacterium]|nr:hypothetical protein [Candidatus Dormibacteraeota bacterium]
MPPVDWRAMGASACIGAGATLVLVGTLLPWVAASGGLQPMNGLTVDGAYLVAAAVGGVSMWVASLRQGGSTALRGLIGGCGVLIAYWAAFDGWQITRVAAAANGAGGSLSTLGPGTPVVVAGGALLLAAAAIAPSRDRPLIPTDPLRIVLAGSLLAAGSIHLQLTPDHYRESQLLGAGFFCSALAQLTLGAVVMARPWRLSYMCVIGLSVVLMVTYAYAVFHGLPIGQMDMAGVRIGAGEAVDLSGAVTQVAQLAGIVVAAALLVHRRTDL